MVPSCRFEHYSGVSVRVSVDKMNIWIGRLSQADCPPQCGWASSTLWTDTSKRQKRFSSLMASELEHQIFGWPVSIITWASSLKLVILSVTRMYFLLILLLSPQVVTWHPWPPLPELRHGPVLGATKKAKTGRERKSKFFFFLAFYLFIYFLLVGG